MHTPKHILLQAPWFLGDQVVFTGVVRELWLETGWSFSINTNIPELWVGHPAIAEINLATPKKNMHVVSRHHCPSFRGVGQVPVHFIDKYLRNLRAELGLPGDHPITRFAGEVPVTPDEAATPPLGLTMPYWLISAGCKTSMPIKAWGLKNYQQVVDEFRGRVLFVQIGSGSDWHPPLRGVVDAVGKTSVRELIQLVHHAQGVLCPITSFMHLAAAVPVTDSAAHPLRPCVVVAGGREAPHFIQYPMHRVLHTLGMLPCCSLDGCGKSRYGEGDCLRPHGIGEGAVIPQCMSLIKPSDVVAAIEFYYRGQSKLPRKLDRVNALFRRLQSSPWINSSPKGVEIGVLQGDMSRQLLLGHLNLHLTMVDPWLRKPDHPVDPTFYAQPQTFFDEAKRTALANTHFAADRRTVLAKPSADCAHEIPDHTLDFVFIDAVHGNEACYNDMTLWLPKLKPGGILCGNHFQRPNRPKGAVAEVVTHFATSHDLPIENDRDNTWFIHLPSKTSQPGRHFRN